MHCSTPGLPVCHQLPELPFYFWCKEGHSFTNRDFFIVNVLHKREISTQFSEIPPPPPLIQLKWSLSQRDIFWIGIFYLPWYRFTSLCLCILLLKDILISSSFKLLWILLLCIIASLFEFGDRFLKQLTKYWRHDYWIPRWDLFSFGKNCPAVLQSVCICILPAVRESSYCSSFSSIWYGHIFGVQER